MYLMNCPVSAKNASKGMHGGGGGVVWLMSEEVYYCATSCAQKMSMTVSAAFKKAAMSTM